MSFLEKYFGRILIRRKLALVACYAILMAVSLFVAFAVRFDFRQWNIIFIGFLMTFFWVIPLKMGVLTLFHHFSGILSYFKTPNVLRFAQALFISSCVIFFVSWLGGDDIRIKSRQTSVPFFPRGVILADLMLSLVILGALRIIFIRPVEIQDLLGREPAELEGEKIKKMLCGNMVLVTGAGGSIGSELCRQIAANSPSQILLVEQCEVQLFQIEQNLIELGYRGIIQPLIGDIVDETRMRQIFEKFRPQILFHAAAHKHVFMMERQPAEAIKNNTFGTKKLVDLAIEYNVSEFVFISTDKAINPTSIMGASKRLAEIYLQARAKNGTGGTKFMAVRFGNVLGSSGSVIPIFQKQIAEGGPVRVTHPEVTRYFMTISEAVGLVLQCAVLGEGGEIFVLDMGSPVKIVDLAKQMIELSGFRAGIDIDIEFTGLRPGEKLYEELQHRNESYVQTAHPEIMRFDGVAADLPTVAVSFDELRDLLEKKSESEIKLLVKKLIPEYQAFLNEVN